MVVATLLLITIIAWGTVPILERKGLATVDPLIGITVRSIVITSCLLIIILISGKGRELTRLHPRNLLMFSGSAVLGGLLGMWTYYTALKMSGETSKIVTISACYPLVTAFLSVLILNEGITFQKLIGTALIVAGVYLVE